jgi:predicted esterase
VQAPVQLFCGEHDLRCPASESKQAYDTLTDLG